MSGLVALDGQRADVIDLSARYRDSDLGASGRVELDVYKRQTSTIPMGQFRFFRSVRTERD